MESTFLPVTQAINCSLLKVCHAPGYPLSYSLFFISQTNLLLEKSLKANYNILVIKTTYLQIQFHRWVLRCEMTLYARICTLPCTCPSGPGPADISRGYLQGHLTCSNLRPLSSSTYLNSNSFFSVHYLKL